MIEKLSDIFAFLERALALIHAIPYAFRLVGYLIYFLLYINALLLIRRIPPHRFWLRRSLAIPFFSLNVLLLATLKVIPLGGSPRYVAYLVEKTFLGHLFSKESWILALLLGNKEALLIYMLDAFLLFPMLFLPKSMLSQQVIEREEKERRAAFFSEKGPPSFFLKANGAIIEEDIFDFEKSMNYPLPRRYRDFLLASNGGAVFFDYRDGERVNACEITAFYSLGQLYRFFEVCKREDPIMPPALFPIGYNRWGDFICIDQDDGTIWYWDREKNQNYYINNKDQEEAKENLDSSNQPLEDNSLEHSEAEQEIKEEKMPQADDPLHFLSDDLDEFINQLTPNITSPPPNQENIWGDLLTGTQYHKEKEE